MAARRPGGLLVCVIFHLIIITLGPLLLLLYLFFTPFSIGGRRITPSWP
jgi:hypothetical protein